MGGNVELCIVHWHTIGNADAVMSALQAFLVSPSGSRETSRGVSIY